MGYTVNTSDKTSVLGEPAREGSDKGSKFLHKEVMNDREKTQGVALLLGRSEACRLK